MFWSNNFDGLEFLYDRLNATEDVEKVKNIGAQQLTQNINAYLMRCDVMTRGFFKVGYAYEKKETHLTKNVTQLKDNLKFQTDKVEDLHKQLLEVKKYKDTVESKYLELETPTTGLIQDVKQARAFSKTLKKS